MGLCRDSLIGVAPDLSIALRAYSLFSKLTIHMPWPSDHTTAKSGVLTDRYKTQTDLCLVKVGRIKFTNSSCVARGLLFAMSLSPRSQWAPSACYLYTIVPDIFYRFENYQRIIVQCTEAWAMLPSPRISSVLWDHINAGQPQSRLADLTNLYRVK